MKRKTLARGVIIIHVLLYGAIVLTTFSSSEVENDAEKCQDNQETTSNYVSSDTAPTIKDYFQSDLPKGYSVR